MDSDQLEHTIAYWGPSMANTASPTQDGFPGCLLLLCVLAVKAAALGALAWFVFC